MTELQQALALLAEAIIRAASTTQDDYALVNGPAGDAS